MMPASIPPMVPVRVSEESECDRDQFQDDELGVVGRLMVFYVALVIAFTICLVMVWC